mgnify:FL=1
MRVIERLRSREWSGRVVDCALRFVLAAVLSGARVFGGYAPLALGLTAAAGNGAAGLSAMLGAAAGAFVFLPFSHALRTAAAGVLIFTANNAFYDLNICRKRAFLPLLTAAMMLSVEFVYVLRDPAGEAANCLVSLLLAALGAMSARALLTPGEGEHPFASLFVLLGVLMAFASYQTANGFAPGRIAAMLAVLLFAFERSGVSAVPASLVIGLSMDLTAGGGSFVHAAGYALAATVVSLTRRGNRVMSALWFALSVLCFALPMDAGAGLVLLYEALAATLLFLLIPSRFFRGKHLAAEADTDAAESAALRKTVSESALALRELYDSVARAPKRTEENPAAIFDRAAEKACRGCSLCDFCWEKEYNRTYTALNDATAALLQHGQGRGEDFPPYFADRCIRFPSFLSAVNEELHAYLLRRQYRQRLAEDHAKAASQYAQLSELLQSAADGAARPAVSPPLHAYRLGLSLRPKRGERVSGDSASHFETDSGALCLLLSDGMGCGEAAKRESAMAARLLERFLRAGIDAPPALKTLNSALALRAEETDSFTTVDLLLLSLQTLEGELYKYGAAPSYLKRGGTVRRVTCSCLPAGLQEGSPPPEATHLHLSPGCFFVMLTDGTADADDDEWLQDLLAGWEGSDPQQLSAAILADCAEKRGETDDALCLVLYIPEDSGGARAV